MCTYVTQISLDVRIKVKQLETNNQLLCTQVSLMTEHMLNIQTNNTCLGTHHDITHVNIEHILTSSLACIN